MKMRSQIQIFACTARAVGVVAAGTLFWSSQVSKASRMLKDKPLSVTSCDLVDCVCVLTNDDDKPIPLHVGGLDIENQMVFLLGDKRLRRTERVRWFGCDSMAV
ncbi:hypothetical protein [Planctomycetes bacterium TBK1r]|uniref:Secreted protein n=1 Tax=Stieleria magnilauensis TaxID=2527963 RepID=A0ABX5XK75_9BACT|nr:hypothetical protein TBK1r_10920 [Planctomycetes bacterium TBK1r]